MHIPKVGLTNTPLASMLTLAPNLSRPALPCLLLRVLIATFFSSPSVSFSFSHGLFGQNFATVHDG